MQAGRTCFQLCLWSKTSLRSVRSNDGGDSMRGTVLYGARDIRFEDRPEPKIQKATDAIIRMSATCVCGSDLWPFRGIQKTQQPMAMGHEYCGVVEEVGSAVKTVKPG